jgi:hypothetical protein
VVSTTPLAELINERWIPPPRRRSPSRQDLLRVKFLKQLELSRDNLDENGRRQSEFEAATGSQVMIDLSREVRK